jgi:peptidyl-prolyl cis-trans isomerase SurA
MQKRGRRAGALVLAYALAHLGGAALAQNAVLVVNGDPITNFDIEQRSKLNSLSAGGKSPARDQVIEELIGDRLKIKEGKKFGIDLPASEVDSQFAAMGSRMRMTPDQLTRMLESKGIRPDTLKSRLKADFVWSQLVRGRYSQSLIVGEKDINSVIEVKGDGKQSDSFEYVMRPIVLVTSRDQGSGSVDSRRKEAEALRNRIQSCDEATEIFRSLREAIIRDPVTKTSADLPPAVREMLDKTQIGRLTPPEVTRQGVEMVALCSRKQTTVDTPAKREAREKLFAQKYEAQSKKYLQDLRRAAMIERR